MRSALSVVFVAAVASLVAASSCATAVECTTNSDCPKGEYCAASHCRLNCSDSARDCRAGEYCDINGMCQSGDAGAPVDSSVGTDGGVADGSAALPDGSVADTGAGPDAASGALRTFDLCSQQSDCKSGLLCKPLAPGDAARCTPVCATAAQCFSAGRCLKVGADQYCVRGDVGRACSGASDCNYACLTPGSYCTASCTSGGDCPNGYGCMTISNQKVCVKAEFYCGGGQTCSSLKCDTSMLVSSCTTSCASAADCPQRAGPLAKWTRQAGSCARPSDVVGPVGQGETAEYACDVSNNVANLCNDAQHIDFDKFVVPSPPSLSCPSNAAAGGAPGDVCVNSCKYAGGCIDGFACTAVGNIANQRIGLCLPSGGGTEVGGSCARDGDCAFGYCSQGRCSRDCSGDGLCPSGSTCSAVGGPIPNVENSVAFRRCQ